MPRDHNLVCPDDGLDELLPITTAGEQEHQRDASTGNYNGPDMPCLRMNKKWASIKIAVSKGSTRT